jgi:PPE-repeat protein
MAAVTANRSNRSTSIRTSHVEEGFVDMDFGALPPEINSARMYSGPGSVPMLTAAEAWEALASELHSSAAAYRSVIAGLTVSGWQGPSSIMMADAIAPYVAWMHGTATAAEQTAARARTAAAAYQTAYAMTVPPPLITTNRGELASLVASNFFGQNSPAIAATEAAYDEMWAQDTAAMYGYASSSAAAARLAPFTDPPRTTEPAGLAAQTAAVTHTQSSAGPQVLSQLTNALHQLASPSTSANPLPTLTATDIFNDTVSSASGGASVSSSSFGGSSIATTNHAIAINAARDATQGIGPFLAGSTGPVPAPAPANLGSPAASAAMGRASLVGTLSVPQTWAATATPPVNPAALELPNASPGAAAPASNGMAPGTFGEALLGTLAGRGVSNVAAKLRATRVVPRSPAAG